MRRMLPILAGAVFLIGALVWGVTVILSSMEVQSAQAAFDDLAEALRNDGYVVELGAISISNDRAMAEDVVVADAGDNAGWRWAAPRVTVIGSDDGRIALAVAGLQRLSYAVSGEARTVEFAARRTQLDLRRNASGRIERIVASLSDFDAAPIVAESAQLEVERGTDGRTTQISIELSQVAVAGDDDNSVAERVAARLQRADGDGAVPAQSTATIEIDKLVMPHYADSPLGSTMDVLTAEFTFRDELASLDLGVALAAWGTNGTLALTNSRFTWGVLSLDAAATLRLDPEHRLDGTGEARVRQFIPVLNAYHAFGRMAGTLRADYYAALLVEAGDRGDDTAMLDLRIEGGRLSVLREGGALDEFALGAIPPILPALATE